MRLIEVLAGLLRPDTWRRVRNVDVIFMCHDVDRAYDVDGLPYSQLLDPVRRELEEEGIVCAAISHRYSRLTGSKAWGSPHSINRASFINALANRVENVMGGETAEVAASRRSIRFWERLLTRSDAKMVLLIGAPPEVCAAANRLKIPVIELLHGFGYIRIPWGYGKRESKFVPSHFIAFDDLGFQTFKEHFGLNSVYIARRNHLPEPQMPSYKGSAHGAVSVLVTLGWKADDGCGLSEVQVRDVVPAQIADAIRLSGDKITWLVRPHPVMMRERRFRAHRRFLVDFVSSHGNCAPLQESTDALDAVLGRTQCHVTMFSETAYEASFRAVPTLFLSPALAAGGHLDGTFQNLVESDKAEIQPAFTGQEIVDWVTRKAGVVSEQSETANHPLASDLVMKIFHRVATGRV